MLHRGQPVRLGGQGDRAAEVPRGADRGGHRQRQEHHDGRQRHVHGLQGRRTGRGHLPAGEQQGPGRDRVRRVQQADQGEPLPGAQVPDAAGRRLLRQDERHDQTPVKRQQAPGRPEPARGDLRRDPRVPGLQAPEHLQAEDGQADAAAGDLHHHDGHGDRRAAGVLLRPVHGRDEREAAAGGR